MKTFRRTHKNEELMVIFDDGERIIVKDREGNVVFDASSWLFEACWARAFFVRN